MRMGMAQEGTVYEPLQTINSHFFIGDYTVS